MPTRPVRINFLCAVWLCIAESSYRFAVAVNHYDVLRARYGPFVGRVVAAPLILAFMEVLLWARFYREDDRTARWAAAWVGAGLSILVVVQLLRVSIRVPQDPWQIGLYTYIALSHLLYAVVGGSRTSVG